jgi:hypothetical protein
MSFCVLYKVWYFCTFKTRPESETQIPIVFHSLVKIPKLFRHADIMLWCSETHKLRMEIKIAARYSITQSSILLWTLLLSILITQALFVST